MTSVEPKLHPKIQCNEVLITPVVSIHPQSVHVGDQPAIIELTKTVQLTDNILAWKLVPICSSADQIKWKELESHECEILDDRVKFKTNHFGYVCVIVRFNPISKSVYISPHEGKPIAVGMKDYPNFKLDFPQESIRNDTKVSVTVSFGDSYPENGQVLTLLDMLF